jgi:hypothetical protein
MQALKLLELPEPIRESIDEGKIAPSIGYEIAKVADPGQQMELAAKVARGAAGRAEVRERTVRSPRAKRWSHTLEDGSQVVVTIPDGEATADEVIERLQKAIKRLRGEITRSRQDAA